MSKVTSSLPLLNILQTRALPLWRQGGMERCLIAPHDLSERQALQRWLATGASISPKPIKSRRVAVKGPRHQENRSILLARWPQDKLQARRTTAFAMVIDGQMDFQIGDSMIHCSTGHSMILLSGTPRPDSSTSHLTGENLKNGHCDLLWIEDKGDGTPGVGCWICHSAGERHFERPGESCYILDPAVQVLFDAFISEAREQRSGLRDICNPLFEALTAALCRSIREENFFQFNYQKKDAPEEIEANKVHSTMPAIQKYIESYFHQPLFIDDVARHFFLSRTEFTQRFKRETGHTFHEYLTTVRLKEARHLLATTTWSIEKIAVAVGAKPSRLRELFHQRHGMPPQQFRRQQSPSPKPDGAPALKQKTGR